jgi:hypothetical protein
MRKRGTLAIASLAGIIGLHAQGGAGIGRGMDRVVTGVPFSAQSTTEVVQTLANGAHVKRTTKGVVARDSSGRTTYSQTLDAIVPGGRKLLTIIRDPVAGVRYVIDTEQKAARREAIRTPGIEKPPQASRAPRHENAEDADVPEGAARNTARQTLISVLSAHGARLNIAGTDTTELGNQMMGGISAAGVRITAIIAARQIGNDRDLTFSSEAWYAQELNIVVKSRVTDPILGDTTFELIHLHRGEPESALFEVPAGYLINGINAAPGGRR